MATSTYLITLKVSVFFCTNTQPELSDCIIERISSII